MAKKKIAATRASLKKAPAKKTLAKKVKAAPAKKAPAKKAASKVTSTKKPAAKTGAKKAVAAAKTKKATTRSAARAPASRPSASKLRGAAAKSRAKAPKKALAKAPAAAKSSKGAAPKSSKGAAPKSSRGAPKSSKGAAPSAKGRIAAPPAPVRESASKKRARVAKSVPPAPPPEPRRARVELAPRSSASVVPSIPIPVKEVARKPTLDERAQTLKERLERQSPEFRSRYNESFEMSWVYHDSQLEGIVYNYEELTTAFRSDEVTVVDSSVMPIYDAIRRHRIAIEYVRELTEKKRVVISVDLIKKLYTILQPDEGDIKTVKYRRDVPQHRLYFHDYAAPDKVAYLVRQVVDWVNSAETRKNVPALRIAGKAHYDLLRAYPFPDESGRIARLFMNLLLVRGGLPAAIIHAAERHTYYEALKAPNPTQIVNMLRDAVENSMSSIEKLLDEHETNKRGFSV